jgi:curved DNA-binding protein
MEFKDYYDIMGVSRDATQDEIKRAYRKLARKYHPDVSKEPDAEARFKEVGEAYEVLKDPEKRAAYDQLGQRWQAGQDFTPPPDWEPDFSFTGGGYTDAEDFSEFFESLFGGGGPFRRARPGGAGGRAAFRGADRQSRLAITLEEAYRGGQRRVSLRVPEVDPQGRVHERTETLDVRIPAGIQEGQRVRLAGKGEPGMGGGPPGDLFLEIQFEPHPWLRVDGRDLYMDLPVTPWEAMLGRKVAVPTLGGTVDLQVPAGSQSGRRLRLKGRGLPGNPPGDQYVVLQIHAPPADSPEARELYEQMERRMPMNPRASLGV